MTKVFPDQVINNKYYVCLFRWVIINIKWISSSPSQKNENVKLVSNLSWQFIFCASHQNDKHKLSVTHPKTINGLTFKKYKNMSNKTLKCQKKSYVKVLHLNYFNFALTVTILYLFLMMSWWCHWRHRKCWIFRKQNQSSFFPPQYIVVDIYIRLEVGPYFLAAACSFGEFQQSRTKVDVF